MSPPRSAAASHQPTFFERTGALVLRPFAEVKPFEVAGVTLLTATAFVLMAAYYFLKVTREPLILESGGAEVKSYAAAGQAVLLLIMTRGYRALADKLPRRPLTMAVFGFFGGLVLLFALAVSLNLPIGVPFYLFVGIFNLTVLSQFWSMANDFYTEEQGKRLFAVLGMGTAIGAIVGGYLGGVVFGWLHTLGPLLIAAVLLGVALAGMLLADRAILRRNQSAEAEAGDAGTPDAKEAVDAVAGDEPAPPASVRAAAIAGIDRYLVLLAAMILLLNAFNSLGEYVLDRMLLESVHERFGSTHGEEAEAAIASFKSSYFTAFNIATLLLQSFVASRALRWLGARKAILILPVVALIGTGSAAIVPVLAVMSVAKIAENAIDYSVQNTAWQSLFLVLTRREKYVAKNSIDTFFVRFGDVCSAGVVFAGSVWLGLGSVAFLLVNLCVGAAWLLVAWLVCVEYPKKAERVSAALRSHAP